MQCIIIQLCDPGTSGLPQPAPPGHLTPPASAASAASAAPVGTPSASQGGF